MSKQLKLTAAAVAILCLPALLWLAWTALAGSLGLAGPGMPELAGPDAPAVELEGIAGLEEDAAAGGERTAEVIPPEVGAPTAAGFDRTALFGRVLDLDGEAIPDATVSAWPDEPRDSWELADRVGQAQSDAEGRWRISGRTPFEPHRLLAEAEGFASMGARELAGRAVDIELHPSHRLHGSVLDRETGEALAEVELEMRPFEATLTPWESTRSDAEGRYQFDSAPAAGAVNLRAWRGGEGTRNFTVETQSEGPTEFDVLLERGHGLRGRIFDGVSGIPIAGASVSDGYRDIAVSDESGEFLIGGVGDSWVGLRVRAAGYARLRYSVSTNNWKPGEVVELPLPPEVVLEGAVLDERRNPVGGAEVRASLGGRERWSRDIGASRRGRLSREGGRVPSAGVPPRLPPGTRIEIDRSDLSAETDAQGRFRIGGLASRSGAVSVRVSASAEGFATARSEQVQIAQPAGRGWIEVQLERATIVTGRVLADGQPARARVLLRGTAEPEPMVLTNDGGEFRFDEAPLSSEALEAFLEGNDLVRARVPVSLREGEPLEQDVLLDTYLEAIRGRVTTTAGEPVAGLEVTARPQEWKPGLRRCADETGEDGSFAIEVPPEPFSLYRLDASQGPVSARLEGIAPGAREANLVLAELGWLGLQPVDASTGESVGVFQMSWRPSTGGAMRAYSSGRRRELRVDERGVFLARLPVGELDLSLHSEGRGYPPLFLRGVAVEAHEDPVPLRVPMEAGLRVEIRFVGERPANGRVVIVRPQDWNRVRIVPRGQGWEVRPGSLPSWSWNTQVLRPDGSGRVVVQPVPAGTWRFKVAPEGYRLDPPQIEVAPGGENRFEVRVSREE